MTETTTRCPACCSSPAVYCGNRDLVVGLDGLQVLEVTTAEEHLRVRPSPRQGRWAPRPAESWR